MISINKNTHPKPFVDPRTFKGIQILPASYYKREKYLLLKDIPKDLLRTINEDPEGIYICGGALTSVFSGCKINDYDICFSDFNTLKALKKRLDAKYNATISTGNAHSYEIDGVKVQLLLKRKGLCVDIIKQFDFTICQAGYYFKEDQFIWVDAFLPDLSAKKLFYNPEHDTPINSLLRVLKFQKRGFHINAFEMIKIALSVQKVEIKSGSDLVDSLSGCSSPTGMEDFLAELKIDLKATTDYNYQEFIKNVMNAEIAYWNVIGVLDNSVEALPVPLIPETELSLDDLPF